MLQPDITGVTGVTADPPKPVTIHSQALLQIDDLVKKIRADLSNLRNGNGNPDTVSNRIENRLNEINQIVKQHSPEALGETIIKRIETVQEQYSEILEKAA